MTKKSEFTPREAYSVAMSEDTGAIVMVRTKGVDVAIMGSLTREQSEAFAASLLKWLPAKASVIGSVN